MQNPETSRKRPPVRDTIGLPFTLFRARDALDYDEAGVMHQAAPDENGDAKPADHALAEAQTRAVDAGMLDGARTHLLFARPGMSLSHAWFKSGFPLPRHSHDADCLYFIVAGSLRIGTEELGPGDGFFVGKDVPYAYVPGESGVEVLEFRSSDNFDIRLLANNPAWWTKAIERATDRGPHWREDELMPPSGITIGSPA